VARDVIVCWPRFADHPLWRSFIARERDRFGEVFVVFTEHDGPDRSGWLRANFGDVTFLDSPDRGSRDWRDVAVNAALDRSTAGEVWFTEQDFLITDPAVFWSAVQSVSGIPEYGGRALHPACIFAPRDLIDRTSRYFGPDPVDHFGVFTDELAALSPLTVLDRGWSHYRAISEGQYLMSIGQPPKFHPELYREWLARSLAADVPLEPTWEALARA
jgi:hypothetical protein